MSKLMDKKKFFLKSSSYNRKKNFLQFIEYSSDKLVLLINCIFSSVIEAIYNRIRRHPLITLV